MLFCILCSDVKVEERALQCGNPPRRNHPPASDGRLPLRNLVLHYPESSLLEIDVSARMEGHGGGWNVQPVLRLAQSETGKTGPFPPAEVEPGRRLSCYGTAALTPTPRPLLGKDRPTTFANLTNQRAPSSLASIIPKVFVPTHHLL